MRFSALSQVIETEQKISDLFITKTIGDDLTWKLKAEEAFIHHNGDRASLKKINLNYFLKKGGEVMISSERAEVEFSENRILLKGNILGNTKDGVSLEAESLLWNGVIRSVTSDGRVLLRRPDCEISGQGMDADITLEKIKINANTKTIIY